MSYDIRRITDDEYDKFYQSFREQVASIDARLGMLQEAEDNYYITAKYLLELANRAYELFERSEVEEKRQLIKLVLQNLRLEGKTVQFEAIKPFDTLLNYNDYQPLLEKRSFNITKRFLRIIEIFQDAKFEQQLRLEIEKVKPALIPII